MIGKFLILGQLFIQQYRWTVEIVVAISRWGLTDMNVTVSLSGVTVVDTDFYYF